MALTLHIHEMMRFITLLTCILGALGAWTKAQGAPSPYQGYVGDVEAEKSQRYYEVYLFIPQKPEPSLKELIFNPLSQEFKEKYRERFGGLDTESITYRSPSWGGASENPVVLEEETKKRKAFAEYMTKRLMEYHVDNYMKTQPQMKPVMEVKEQIQNVKVEVTKEVRANIQYNFAGNVVEVIVDNPWCDSKLALEMDPSSFGPTDIQETRLWVSRSLSHSLRANSNVAMTDGIAAADLTRTFERYQIATSMGLSSAFNDSGTSPREVRYLLGFSHTF
ncbi:MAG: hypothetical protein ACAH59_03485 [Pseudobdellovibrionaceae bacterium]